MSIENEDGLVSLLDERIRRISREVLEERHTKRLYDEFVGYRPRSAETYADSSAHHV